MSGKSKGGLILSIKFIGTRSNHLLTTWKVVISSDVSSAQTLSTSTSLKGFMGGFGVKVQHFPLTFLVVLTTLSH